MSLARLVVIEGPDAGREFELPLRGGGTVGRGDGCLVQLTDPGVSRHHGLIELRDGALCWVDDTGKARTLINGRHPAVHRLAPSDEIVLGATKLVYVPVDGVAVTRAASHVTMEVSSRQLLALVGSGWAGGELDRARRHLSRDRGAVTPRVLAWSSNVKIIVVPRPCSDSTESRPPSSLTTSARAASPTPRPESSETLLRVVSPSWMIAADSSACVVPGCLIARARSRTATRSTPRPPSLTRTIRRLPSVAASMTTRPLRARSASAPCWQWRPPMARRSRSTTASPGS